MPGRGFVVIGALLLLSGGCGARTGLGVDDAGADGTSHGGEVTDPRGCEWVPAARAVTLSTLPEGHSVSLLDAALTSGGALVAFGGRDTRSVLVAYGAHIGFDLTRSETQLLLGDDVYQNVYLANDFGHTGVVGFDMEKCLFRRMTAGGEALGATQTVERRRCGGVAATARGFDMLVLEDTPTTMSVRILHAPLDPSGAPLSPAVTLFTSVDGRTLGVASRVTLADGTFLAIHAPPGPSLLEGGSLLARHFDASGSPLTPEVKVVERSDFGRQEHAVVATKTGALAAWPVLIPGRIAPTDSELHVSSLDHDGRPTAESVPVVTGLPEGGIGSFALAPDAGGALLAWTASIPASYRSSARVVPLGANGKPRGSVIVLDDAIPAKVVPGIRLVVAGTSALVFVETAPAEGGAVSIHAVPLRCRP